MTLGYRNYKVIGDGYTKLYRLIMADKIPARNMHEKNGLLFLTLSVEYTEQFEKICSENGYETEILKQKGAVNIFRFIIGRPGLIAGFAVSLAALFYFSNIALRFDVLCSDEKVRQNVMNVLEDEGITAGSYIPSIDLVVTERALKQKVDGISWAGITVKGNSLIIDVVKNIEKPDFENERLPTNLVACENGVIEKLEVFGGQVLLGAGCGVSKGDTIVSGEVVETKSKWIDGKEDIKVRTRYVRSKGKIFGTFERTLTFEQNFKDERKVESKDVLNKKYLTFFNADIPLFFKTPKGYYSSKVNESNLNLLGFKTPLGIKNCDLTKYEFETTVYSKEQALELVRKKAFQYEKNFLGEYEIKDRQTDEEFTENGVKTTITYTLYGVMSREVEFFVNKK